MRYKKKGVYSWKRGKLGLIQTEIKEFTMEEKPKKKYTQDWKAYDLAQTHEFKIFQDILVELIDSTLQVRKKLYKAGRPFLDLKDMIYCCVMKTYMNKSSRRNIGYLQLAKGLNYIQKIPHFSTVLNYYKHQELTPLLKHLIEQSAIPLRDVELDYAIDSSGFSTCIFSRWFNARRGDYSQRRMFRKAHVVSGTKTNIITTVNITEGYCHDSPQFESLIRTTAKNMNVREVSADAAYLSRNSFNVVHEVGAIPYIMFRKNSSRKALGSLIYKRMFNIFQDNRSFFLEHYHKRSNAESVFHMLKRKFGLYLYCKTEIAQTNELLCKCISHNICVLIQELFEANTALDFEKCEKKEVRGYSTV